MLTEKQEELSRCFATASAERYEGFCRARYHVAATGAPIIEDTLAFVDARVVAEYPGGDHVIYLGQWKQWVSLVWWSLRARRKGSTSQ